MADSLKVLKKGKTMDQAYVTSNQRMQAMTAHIAAWARRGLRLPAYRQPLWEMKPHPGADPVFVARAGLDHRRCGVGRCNPHAPRRTLSRDAQGHRTLPFPPVR